MREPRHVTEADFARWEQLPGTRHMQWREKWAVCKQNDNLLSKWEQNFLASLRIEERDNDAALSEWDKMV